MDKSDRRGTIVKMKRLFVSGLMAASSIVGLSACGVQEDTSSQKITNGLEIASDEYKSVVMLYDPKQGAICTGTFISDDTVISAAHCTMSGKANAQGNVTGSLVIVNPINIQAGQVEQVAKTIKMVRNPLWEKNGKNVNKWDLSVLTFPKGTARAVSEIASSAPVAKDPFVIVGYGLNQSKNLFDGSTAGVKRLGNNVVGSVTDGFIQFKGQSATTTADGTKSSASGGDSGGPLFVDGKLAGITSGGAADWFGFGSSSTSLYVDLNSPESQAFLSKHITLPAAE